MNTQTPPVPPSAAEVTINFAHFYQAIHNLCVSGQSMYRNTKVFLTTQYAKVKENDTMTHNLMLAIFALSTLYMGGMWSMVPFAAGALSNGLFPEKLQELIDKVNFLWNDTRSGKLALCATALMVTASNHWQIGAVLLGIHVANLLKENSATNQNAASEKSEEPKRKEPSDQGQGRQTPPPTNECIVS